MGRDVCLQAQDKALVFCKGDASYFLYSCGNCVRYLQKFLLEGVTKNIRIPFDPLIIILYLGKK
jgi:hypothetical protein